MVRLVDLLKKKRNKPKRREKKNTSSYKISAIQLPHHGRTLSVVSAVVEFLKLAAILRYEEEKSALFIQSAHQSGSDGFPEESEGFRFFFFAGTEIRSPGVVCEEESKTPHFLAQDFR